ncbi:SDR family oxidoreductase [Massilia sp. CF038]|uniref:SDR family oxidoreductase n=1 Tax=Massilia sp. CF038 TaxID=1881045 RepID=UPI0009206B8E|nr:SDR family oxidoreductase [Massilia sp. CF038]SHH45903.1 NAD dependent epimerase/dehydratase family enzyme [Massilia sp. CF038]
MRILLTGASGMIGRPLLAALLAQGHQVLCAMRSPPKQAHPRLTFVQADFSKDSQQSIWQARLKDIDVVINTVGIFRESGTQTFARLHTDTPCALFAASAASDSVQLVIQVSALGADQDADTAYHLSKKAADDYLASLPLRACIVQPSLVYGKDGVSARLFKVLASMPFGVRFGKAPQLVQPIHLDDVVAAIVGLLHQPLPVAANGATAHRIALVGPAALSFTDYLATLRAAMGMGKLRILRLPALAGRLLASAGIGLLDRDTLRMLDRGNSADPAATERLLGHAPRAAATFIEHPSAERLQAKLGWLLPPLRWSIAFVWIATAVVSAFFYPEQLSLQLLERTGVPPELGPLMLYGACVFDLALGLGILLLKRRRWLWRAQLALIGFYTVVIAFKLPEFLLHPYGPLTKNLPMLAAIWLLAQCEEE